MTSEEESEKKAGIVAWYNEGASMNFLADAYNVAHGSVWNILHKENVKIRMKVNRHKTEIKKDKGGSKK